VRILSEYAKKLTGKFEIKAGFMEGRILSMEEFSEIAALPGKEALYAKVLGTMLAPITSLAVCLGQILEQKGGTAADAAAE
jgi:large subunit ribosomal protein L10